MSEELGATEGARLSVLGWAYKGWPPTDDMRGSPISAMMPVFADAGIHVLGHDPMVTAEAVRRYGAEPVSLDTAFASANGVLIITDHPDYRAIRPDVLLQHAKPRFIYDSWRILDESMVIAAGVRYAGLGYRAPARART
jgi:UDP-N-acetyl-D-mannosaminuronic acid dehydrogenase